ncbi:MAG: hypothetical protein HFACDABA_00197 [Anaerolineales bacterium]|nr:hypothetical protein [Anaerolineales bacterium]
MPLARQFKALLATTILNAFFYAAMEWVFFVTKPSALSLLSLAEKIRVLFAACGMIALAGMLLLAILCLPALLTKNEKLVPLACLAPAFLLSVNALILFDNFTYTVFKFGIATSENLWRIPYLVGFILFLAWMTRRTHLSARKKTASLPALGLLAVSLTFILPLAFSRGASASVNADSDSPAQSYPNIIILGGDGLSASYLSVYGFSKGTTPFLEQLAEESLLAQNAFVNASSTTASTTSMLTGRYPMDTQVFRYPDVLTGADSFMHLPAILKAHGYETVEIGAPSYVDAGKLNLLGGFDVVNNRTANQPAEKILLALLGNTPSTQFLVTVIDRAEERLLHIFFLREMSDPIKQVTDPKSRMTDEQRVQQIADLLASRERPLFIFAHFMDTHGPHFSSSQRVFSTGESDEEWDKARYEDALLSFDGSVEKIYRHLQESGQLENTILVVYTDHGFLYSVTARVPLLIRFPDQAHAGIRSNNLQVIDVPVTLLDYLGIEKPEWMSGLSFLDFEPPKMREIVSIVAGSPKKINPPFFQIKSVTFIVCHKFYSLNAQENKFVSGNIAGHTARCEPQLMPLNEEIRAEMIAYLERYGYDVSSLK